MIRSVIVDDEAPARRRMKKLLASATGCELVGEAESGKQAIEIIYDLKPDLIFLDIQLKDMTGFDVLHELNDMKLQVIFITAYDEYAIKAFEENAIDYLLKPYKEERFYEAVKRAKEKRLSTNDLIIDDLLNRISETSKQQKIQIPEGKTIHLMDGDNIEYIQADTYYCNFYLEGEKNRVIRISLKVLETILPENFIRISKSLIVNKDKILRIRQLKNTLELELNSNSFTLSNQYIRNIQF